MLYMAFIFDFFLIDGIWSAVPWAVLLYMYVCVCTHALDQVTNL